MPQTNYLLLSRVFYGLGIIGMAVLQFLYADFRPVFLQEWPLWAHSTPVWAYLFGIALVIPSIFIIAGKQTRKAAIFLGWLFLFMFLCVQVPYQLFIFPHSAWHVGVWINPLKELALSGGAFVLAGNIPENKNKNNFFDKATEMIIPLGRIFFSITLIEFGYAHFLYLDNVATLVPAWIPGKIFWSYFGGVALIGSGVCIILKIRLRLIAFQTAIMLFAWFIILHIPRAIADPYGNASNEVTSVFQALAFSGIAIGIGLLAQPAKNKVVSTNTNLQPSL